MAETAKAQNVMKTKLGNVVRTIAPNFNGTLNQNEMYTMYNQIMQWEMVVGEQHQDPIVAKVIKSVSRYGDKIVKYMADIQFTDEFYAKMDGAHLLESTYNDTVLMKEAIIDMWRRTWVSIDRYFTARAFSNEGRLNQFNGYIVSTLLRAFKVFKDGYVRTRIGIKASTAVIGDLEIEVPARDGTEATQRLRAAAIGEALDLFVLTHIDNSRTNNPNGFIMSVDFRKADFIINTKYLAEVRNSSTYMAYHDKVLLKSIQHDYMWNKKWFGKINTSTAIGDGKTVVSLVEMNEDGTKAIPKTGAIKRLYPGFYVPNGVTAAANESYTIDESVFGIFLFPEDVVCMEGYHEETSFPNASNLQQKHYAFMGLGDVYFEFMMPIVRVTLKEI